MSAHPHDEPLRVGVIGLGYAGTTHLEAFAAMDDVEVVALAGKETDRLHERGYRYGVSHLFEDGGDLVALSGIDAVSIATPNSLHAPLAIAALRHGKHVFCEKPLAIAEKDARATVAAAHAANRVLEVAFNHRRRADVRYARHHISSGALGQIYHTRASWKRRAGIPGLRSWFTSRSLAGGGALIDLGPHVIDAVLHLLGEPRVVAVSAVTHGALGRAGFGAMNRAEQMASDSPDFEVEDLASALLRLDDGGSVALEISWAGHTVDDEDIAIEVLGVDGGLRLFVPRFASDDTLRLYRDDDGVPIDIAPSVHVAGGEHPLVMREFVDTVRSGVWDAHHGDSALHRTAVIDACYRSAAENREVRL